MSGATSYAVLVRGYKGSGNVNGGGPPFQQDTYKVTVGPKTIAFKAPDRQALVRARDKLDRPGLQGQPGRSQGPVRDRARDRDGQPSPAAGSAGRSAGSGRRASGVGAGGSACSLSPPVGVTDPEAVEAGPVPALFVAVTVKV